MLHKLSRKNRYPISLFLGFLIENQQILVKMKGKTLFSFILN